MSCSHGAVDTSVKSQIVFRATVETRGTQVTDENLERFYVTALAPEFVEQGAYLKTYFEDVEFTLAANGNYYSNPPYYYPSTLPINFFLYYPSEEEMGTNFCWDEYIWDWEKQTGYWEHDCYIYRFSPNASISRQCDFVFTIVEGAVSGSDDDPQNTVFEHMLSQIQVFSKSASTTYQYIVAGLKLGNISNVASLDTSSQWDIIEGEVTDYFDIYDTPVVLSEEYLSIMHPDSGNAFLLPQKLPDDAYVAAYIQVRDLNGNKVFPYGNEEYEWVSTSISGQWYGSEKYDYKLDFTTWFESQL